MPVNRRSFIKGAGVAAGTAALAGTGAARIDDAIDIDGGLQEIIVVFEDYDAIDILEGFPLPDGYHVFQELPYAFTRAEGAVIEELADEESVRWIDYNHEIELHNDDTRELTGASAAHDFHDENGNGIHVAMIDSGLSPHPDLVDKIEHNYKYTNPLSNYSGDSNWVDAGEGDIDDIGHGTHVAGTFGGNGEMSSGQYAGTAPGVDKITSYRVDGPTGLFLHVVSALDHLLAKQRSGEVDVQLINNSWGWTRYGDFNPNNAVNLAFWRLVEEGVLPLFSAGNDADLDTLNPYARAPYVATIAATHSGDFGGEKEVTSFSSQGRPPESEMEDGGYAEGFDASYETTEGAQYDRQTAIWNLQRYYTDDPMNAPPAAGEYVEEFSSDVPATVRPPLSGPVAVEDAETVEWESPHDAGLLCATVTWEPRNQSIEVEVYPTENPDNAIGGPYPANINDGRAVIEFNVPIEPDTSYTFEFRGQNNIDAEATVELHVLQDVSQVEGPLGVYRPAIGAPGDNVVSTLPPSNVLWPLAPALFEGAEPTEPFYDALSGTSMSCPAAAGVAALVYGAYREKAGFFPKPIDVINILEASAEGGTDDELASHHEANMGAGFVDAEEAVLLAYEKGEAVSQWDAPEDVPLDRRGSNGDGGSDGPGQGNGSNRPGNSGNGGSTQADTAGRNSPVGGPAAALHPELYAEIELCTFGEGKEFEDQ